MKKSKNNFEIDGIDKIILKTLMSDARTPIQILSKKTGISGAAVHQRLKKLEKDGVEYVFYEKPKFSQHTKDLLPSILENSLIGVEEQKKMKWGKGNIFFIRPIRWMLLFFGDECIQTSILNTIY